MAGWCVMLIHDDHKFQRWSVAIEIVGLSFIIGLGMVTFLSLF